MPNFTKLPAPPPPSDYTGYVGRLFPLWDSTKQTLADKMVKTVVVRV